MRAWHPARPALADEIQNEYFFLSPFDNSTGWRLNPEVQIADFALAELLDAIMLQQVRLRGRRETKDDAEDVDPTEIKRTGISIFTNTVDRWQPTTRASQFKQLPKYLNVHCYPDEIAALIGVRAATEPTLEPAEAAPAQPGVATLSPAEACRALIEAHKDSDRPKNEIESAARAISDFQISTFPSMWKTYASLHQKRRGRRPGSTAAG